MDLDSFFGLEEIVKELMLLSNYNEDDRLIIIFLHVIGAALFFVASVLTSPLKVLRPFFSWLGAIWLQQTIMAVIFIGLAFFITKGELTMSRTFFLYSALLLLTIVMHADLAKLMPESKMNKLTYKQDHYGRIDFSFHKRGEIPKNS